MEPGEERTVQSEEELVKIQKDLWNAIRSVNIQLIEEIIAKYQKSYDIINRPDTDAMNQSSIFLAVRLKDKEAAYTITKLLLEHGT